MRFRRLFREKENMMQVYAGLLVFPNSGNSGYLFKGSRQLVSCHEGDLSYDQEACISEPGKGAIQYRPPGGPGNQRRGSG